MPEMTIDKAREELATLENRVLKAVAEFHIATSMVPEISVRQTEITAFGDAHPRFTFHVVVEARLTP